jgi:hypothetical protein
MYSLYIEKKSCDTKPEKGFVHATKLLKGLLVCNEIETLFQFRTILRNPRTVYWVLDKCL